MANVIKLRKTSENSRNKIKKGNTTEREKRQNSTTKRQNMDLPEKSIDTERIL